MCAYNSEDLLSKWLTESGVGFFSWRATTAKPYNLTRANRFSYWCCVARMTLQLSSLLIWNEWQTLAIIVLCFFFCLVMYSHVVGPTLTELTDLRVSCKWWFTGVTADFTNFRRNIRNAETKGNRKLCHDRTPPVKLREMIFVCPPGAAYACNSCGTKVPCTVCRLLCNHVSVRTTELS